MRKLVHLLLIMFLVFLLVLTGCSTQNDDEAAVGSLQFTANGEDFIREGFVTKDGWHLSFDHVFITLSDITGYQSNPPYEPEVSSEIAAVETVVLEGVYTVDLAEGDETAEPILVGTAENVPSGHYNAISWNMVKAADGEFEGYSLVLLGKAEKDGQNIDFNIKLDPEFIYQGGEYIGDEGKGFVEAEGIAELEMTFHFDHLFGDGTLPESDELNLGAFGFEPFVSMIKDNQIDVGMAELGESLSPEQYQTLLDVFPGFGHVGEGHAYSEQL